MEGEAHRYRYRFGFYDGRCMLCAVANRVPPGALELHQPPQQQQGAQTTMRCAPERMERALLLLPLLFLDLWLLR